MSEESRVPRYDPIWDCVASLEVEELIRATKLCEACRPIFDPSLRVPYKIEPYWTYYKHHESVQTLRQSVLAGCRICTLLSKRWAHRSASEDKDCEGVSFSFGPRAGEIEFQGHVHGFDSLVDILRLQYGECKINQLLFPLRPNYSPGIANDRVQQSPDFEDIQHPNLVIPWTPCYVG